MEELQAPGLLLLVERSFFIYFDFLESYSRWMRNRCIFFQAWSPKMDMAIRRLLSSFYVHRSTRLRAFSGKWKLFTDELSGDSYRFFWLRGFCAVRSPSRSEFAPLISLSALPFVSLLSYVAPTILSEEGAYLAIESSYDRSIPFLFNPSLSRDRWECFLW